MSRVELNILPLIQGEKNVVGNGGEKINFD